MMTSRRIQPWRWMVKVLQALLILGIPFISVKDESALRFDIPSLTLHFFGARIGMDEFFLVLVAILFIGFLIVLLTIMLGRIWCGWLCPQTVIADFTAFVDRAAGRGAGMRIVSLGAVLLISAILSASLIWYFISPYEFLTRLAEGSLGRIIGWFWTVLTVITFLNFAFLRRLFCITVCPYAKMQGALYDDRTLVIVADSARMVECMHCDACFRACPVGIDVRDGLQAACINCAECVDACAVRMEKRQRPSLIGYRFGIERSPGRTVRRGLVLATLSTVVFLGLLLFLVASRQFVDLALAADPASPPRRSKEGQVVNTYILSLTNRTDTAMMLDIKARMEGAFIIVRPNTITIEGRDHRRVPIEVKDTRNDAKALTRSIMISVSSETPRTQAWEAEAVFLPPW